MIVIDDHYPVGWCGPAIARAAEARRRIEALRPFFESGRLTFPTNWKSILEEIDRNHSSITMTTPTAEQLAALGIKPGQIVMIDETMDCELGPRFWP